jgi:hypothetical protein
MPLRASSFFIPTGSTPFVLEDIYLRGGLRVVPTMVERDAIVSFARKAGMLVVTADNNKIWQLDADLITFNEFSTGGGKNYAGISPIAVLINGDISIDLHYLVPQTGEVGDFLVKDSASNPSWQSVNLAGVSGTRLTTQYKTPGAIEPLVPFDFVVHMSQAVMMLETTLDVPGVKLEGFAKPDRAELNPYTFISTPDILSDTGITLRSDGTQAKGRRYNVLANLETPALSNIYWRITNTGQVPVMPTIDFTYLIMQ